MSSWKTCRRSARTRASVFIVELFLHESFVMLNVADRNALVHGAAPVAHPMYNDVLDPRADDESFDCTRSVEFAARVVVGALQQQVRSLHRLRLVV